MVKVKDILPLIQWNDVSLVNDEIEEICLLRRDCFKGCLSDDILDRQVTSIENDENISDTVVIHITGGTNEKME